MSEPHLKPRQHYSDLYDKFTVEECRSLERIGKEVDMPESEGKTVSPEEQDRRRGIFNELHLYFVTGERYKNKLVTIDKWMKLDEERDRFFERAQAPKHIPCITCSREMFVSSKHLETHLENKDRVMFFYDCTLGHLPMRVFYDNGDEGKREKPRCPKCHTPFIEEDKTTEEKFITVSTCSNCGHTETSEIERTVDKQNPLDPKFLADRERFCLSDKEGMKYVDWMRNLTELTELFKKDKEKENQKDLYDAVAKIKRLKIIEVEQLLVPILEKENYIKLYFKDPEITKDVIVPFVVHDIKQGREERSSCLDLQSTTRKTLENTNWRLMSDGVHYRLGMLEGRLRAYEKEEDLVNLIQPKI